MSMKRAGEVNESKENCMSAVQSVTYILVTYPLTQVIPYQLDEDPLQTFPEFHPVFRVQLAPAVDVYRLFKASVSTRKVVDNKKKCKLK